MEEEEREESHQVCNFRESVCNSYETHFGGERLRNTKQQRVFRPFNFFVSDLSHASDGLCMARKTKKVWFSPWLGF